jgi:hypothetical protein
MRADMDKVIVERPRVGSRAPSRKKGYRKYCQQVGIENLPRREPLPGRWRGRERQLNEHLGPMRRFLRSRVGRPWNKVHQELCEHVSFNNAVQMHVLTHVFDYVCRLVEYRGRNVVRLDNWYRGIVLRPGQMYVCPRTGILKVVKRRPGRPAERVGLRQLTQYHRRDGNWWELKLRKRPDAPDESLWDIWLDEPVHRLSEEALRLAYGGKLFAISSRPLSPREARDLHRTLRVSQR